MYRHPYKVQIPRSIWDQPCWLCGAVLPYEASRQVDLMAQTVECDPCQNKKLAAIARALLGEGDASDR